MALDEAQRHLLWRLECELHGLATRQDRARLEQLLHPAFREHGRSGRRYNREEILTRLTAESVEVCVQAQDFELQMLADGVCLLTYRSAHRQADGSLRQHSNRCSIWSYEPVAGWQMRFHQGTPSEPFEA
ncbi:DUF4440 domain-containing protein [Roseateles sp.]|jgi:hypothetical protein|uniref:nuclear transport factor 2 family protein n=1 Tax=Roseateles sp. TaxID=1971397 RepID=UPI00391BFA55